MAANEVIRERRRRRKTAAGEPEGIGEHLDETIGGRFFKGLASSPFTFARGMWGLGTGVKRDLENLSLTVAEELTGRELPGEEAEEVRDRELFESTREFGSAVGESFVGETGTVETLKDLTLIPNLMQGESVGEAVESFKGAGERFSEDPFWFTVEHVGNVSLAGALLARPAQLGVAASRGAITPGAAARATLPAPGAARGTRATARHATREAAEEGSRAASTALNLENVIGHPYISAGKAVGRSTPVQLMRNPLERSEAISRLAAYFRQEGGALNFRPEDPRRRYNDLIDDPEITRDSRKLSELRETELDLRAHGYEVPESGRFEPTQADPSDLVAERDFTWFDAESEAPTELGDLGTARGFAESVVRGTRSQLLREGRELTPDSIEIIPHQLGEGADIAYIGPNGEPVGSLVIDPDMGMSAGVLPEYQGQGIAKRLYQRAVDEGLPVQRAAESTTFSDQGAGLAQRILEDVPEGQFTRSGQAAETPQSARPSAARTESDSGFIRDTTAENPRSAEYRAGQELLDALDDVIRSEEGSLNVFGKGIAKHQGQSIGPLDFVANELGIQGKNIGGVLGRTVGQNPQFQQVFGPVARQSRRVRRYLQQGATRGTGPIGETVAGRIGRLTGNQNLRRQWDPSFNERVFLRDIGNLHKRGDPSLSNLIRDLDIDRITPGSVPRRMREVTSGARVIGQTGTPEGLLQQVKRVIDEAHTRARSNNTSFDTELYQLVPNTDPMGLHLLALNAAELAQGLPQNSLVNAFGDYIGMDRFSDLNRQAQAAMRQAGEATDVTPERFRLPDEALDVDINSMPTEIQDIFYGAARQYRDDLARFREPTLVQEGVITPSGSRIGLHADQPTRFSTNLEDLPLDQSTRSEIRQQRSQVGRQQESVQKAEARLEELRLSERPMHTRDPEVPLTYRQGRPTQASLDRAWQTTPTGEAVRRWERKLATERQTLMEMEGRLRQLEDAARVDPANAPASARNLLTYANEVAPEQARVLRQMAADGQGNSRVLESLAEELEAMPKTVEDLNSAEVYVSYLRDVKDRGNASRYGAGFTDEFHTREPGGARYRQTSNTLETRFERDFRTRAYWQDSEFQNWLMRREADNYLHRSGVVRTGREFLEDAGIDPDTMTPAQIQQWMESKGYKAYHPEQIFTTSRKQMPPSKNPLEGDWIHSTADGIVGKALKEPGRFERYLAEGIWDPLLQTWKIFALPLRPGWHVNNAAGNAALTMTAGKVSPADYPRLMRASQEAVRNWNQGIVSEVRVPLTPLYKAELTAKLAKIDPSSNQASLMRKFLDEGYISVSNEVLTDIANQGITRGDFAFLNNSQFMREVSGRNIFRQFGVDEAASELRQQYAPDGSKLGEFVRRSQNLKQTGREFVDYSYHLNETVDNFHRVAVYLDQLGKGNLTGEIVGSTGLADAGIAAHVNKALGDYTKLNAFERRIVKRIYPFYPWMRHITEVTMRSMHPSNINRTIIFAHMMDILGEPNEYEEKLPDWAGGHIYVGQEDDGTPRFLSTRGLNPWMDVFQVAELPNMQGLLRPVAPPIQIGYERLSGVSTLTGEPITAPTAYGARDYEARTPLSEYFFRSFPQAGAARDVYRDLMDQPLTRYGTGEPAFFPGAERNKSGMQSVQQIMGINIQPMNVQQMHNQEQQQKYRQQMAERQQERQEELQGGRTIGDLLSSIPGLGG